MKQHLSQLVILLTALLVNSSFAAELTTITAITQPMPEESRFDGRVKAVRQATVSAETYGRIEQINVDIGDQVASGTTLLTVTSTEQYAAQTQAEANLADANSNLIAETAEFQRINDLYKKQYVSKAELDRATARLNSAKARAANMNAALKTARQQLSYTAVKAPYNGIVSARHVEPGETVQPGTLLLSGYNPDFLRVEVDLPQKTAEKARKIMKAHIIRTITNNDTLSEIIQPTHLILYPTADPATSTIRARLDLPEQTAGLRPGEFVTVVFVTGEAQRLLIPIRCLVYRSEVTAVYVVDAGVAHLRQIRTGDRYGDNIEILAGVIAGEQIATDPVLAAMTLTHSTTGGLSD